MKNRTLLDKATISKKVLSLVYELLHLFFGIYP